MTVATTVKSFLTDKGIEYDVVSHPKTYSSAETAAAAHIPDDHIAKGVVLKDEDGYMLAVIPGSEWINMERVRDEMNRDLHLATEEEITSLLPDCQLGAVPPIGEAYGLDTILDEDLTSLAKVYLEAGSHEELVVVSNEQFNALMKGVRHGHFCAVA